MQICPTCIFSDLFELFLHSRLVELSTFTFVHTEKLKLKETCGVQNFRFLFKIHFGDKNFPQNNPHLTKNLNSLKVLESAQENSKISRCFVLWEP